MGKKDKKIIIDFEYKIHTYYVFARNKNSKIVDYSFYATEEESLEQMNKYIKENYDEVYLYERNEIKKL